MEHFLTLVIAALSVVAYTNGEPPVGDSVTIVSDVESNPSTAYGSPSAYSNYQPTVSAQSPSYTSAITTRTGYQNPRSAYGTAYLPVIPVSAYFSSPTHSELYGQKVSPVYGAGTPWAPSTQGWNNNYNPWATSSTAGPWASSSPTWVGSQTGWPSSGPWSSGSWPSSGPWANSAPWASSSSQSWNGASRYQK